MAPSTRTVFVVGATGATGKCVVQQLLDLGHKVKVVVRSEDRMASLLKDSPEMYGERLDMMEACFLDLTDDQLEELIKGCDAVVQCLGHNMTFKGIFGKPYKLCTEAAQRLTQAIQRQGPRTTTKFIMMGSDGVANPNMHDDPRTCTERIVLSILRCIVPPHADNEAAAAHVHGLALSGPEWVVVRPTDLINANVTKYNLFDKPQGGLFGSGVATRANVAHSMVELITNDELWDAWKFKMPVLIDAPSETKKAA